MPDHNFRHDAHTSLKRAKDEIATGDDERLKYACVELRMSMEALTYDRANSFKEDLPQSEYETWQPRKVLQVLLEIDPLADQGSTLAVGKEDTLGVPAKKMRSLGTEKVLNMSILKKHYDALGNFLHIPTLGQISAGNSVNPNKLRRRCNEIVAYLDEVLASPIFNVNFRVNSSIECGQCGNTIRKRLPRDGATTDAECADCPASYTLHVSEGKDDVRWEPHEVEVACANKVCGAKTFVWRRDVVQGKSWSCEACGRRSAFDLGIRLLPA